MHFNKCSYKISPRVVSSLQPEQKTAIRPETHQDLPQRRNRVWR